MHDNKTRDYSDFEGPTNEERTLAMQRYRRRHWQSSSADNIVGGGKLVFGTPRKGKNTKFAVAGVRVS